MTPHDAWLARRTSAIAVLTLLVATAIVVATDEAHSTLGMRAARLAAFTPGIAALAVLAACSEAVRRGEARALEALGAPPWRVGAGAVAAGWGVGLLGLLVLVSPVSETAALFPSVVSQVDWVVVGNEFHADAWGVWIPADGVPAYVDSVDSPGSPPASPSYRELALGCVAPLAAVAPPWAALPLSWRARAIVGAITVLGAVTVMHALGSLSLSPVAGTSAAFPMLLQGSWWGVRRAREA